MRRVLFIVAALLVMAVGCKNRDKEVVVIPSTTLDVETTEVNISHEAQKVEIEVVCNEEFDVEIVADWLRLYNILERDGVDVVVLSIEANDVEQARSADVVIVAGELRHAITLTQSGVVVASMEVAIGHRNQMLASPKWGGEAVRGSINWGDGVTEEYAEGVVHEYADDDAHIALFTMSGTTSFEIERIGDMESLTIAVN